MGLAGERRPWSWWKPAMDYLDIAAGVAAQSPVPVAAYQVGGEYSMISAAAERGWIDRRSAMLDRVDVDPARRCVDRPHLLGGRGRRLGEWVGRSVTW